MLKKNNLRGPLSLWLLLCILLVVAMILLGGATRLTESGLSIVEWKPITGIIPPLSEEAWALEFEKYKAFPEYQLKHMDLMLSDFKFIFYMEYSHRLLGRFLGLVFLLPLFFFWKHCEKPLRRKLLVILALGMIQGGMGWYMVKSGLVNNPYVSHYRLAAHLSLAFLLLFFMLSALLSLYPDRKKPPQKLNFPLRITFFLTSVTIIYGAFVAGLRAGKLYDTFPKMGGDWVPSEWLFYTPVYTNFLENPATVQWVHRVLAMLTGASCLWLINRLWVLRYKTEAVLLFLAVSLQITLGIITVLYIVPIKLALLHQCGAVILFSFLSMLFIKMRS